MGVYKGINGIQGTMGGMACLETCRSILGGSGGICGSGKDKSSYYRIKGIGFRLLNGESGTSSQE